MEENSENNLSNESNFEDFKDFDEGEAIRPELEAEEIGEGIPQSEHEESLLKEAELIKQLTQGENFENPELEETAFENEENKEISQEVSQDNEITENKPEETESETPQNETPEENNQPEQSQEPDEDNAAVKKYIFYISKDFVPLIDSMSQDERTGYINDAIQKKIDAEYEYSSIDKKKRILTHIITMVLTFFIVAPITLFLVHKSIMATFENYKYSQENFEKLYKQRFEKDRAYMRSLEYNRLHNKDNKKEKTK